MLPHYITVYEPSEGFVNHDMDTSQADMWKINRTKYIYKQVNMGYFWLNCFINQSVESIVTCTGINIWDLHMLFKADRWSLTKQVGH